MTKIRGIDAAVLEIHPVVYNSISGELYVLSEMMIEILFEGGGRQFCENRLRNRWWDQILTHLLLNFPSLPKTEYNLVSSSETEDFEYVLIIPDNPDYIRWADSIKVFRTMQGIRTGIFTLNEIGGNDVTLIKNFIENAYNTWVIPPAAILLLADYGTGSAAGNGIISPVYDSYCISDNIFGDVDGNYLPDIVISRITAQNDTQLESMVGRFINYERTPPQDQNFYDHPLGVTGWQSTGVNVLCSEVILGFWQNILGKQPARQYTIVSGTPSVWPSDPYSLAIISAFGPSGLGYIPSDPLYLTDWSGSASGINSSINTGAFAVNYLGTGSETGWGAPAYNVYNLSGLINNLPPYIFSISSLTGKFNYGSECFAEAIHRNSNGALGIIAASEVTYSAVDKDFLWGLYDYLWPEFLTGIYPAAEYRDIMPAFANAAAKFYIYSQSTIYYNPSMKEATYNLYHCHGDAFTRLYTEHPQNLTVIHDSVLTSGQNYFTVTANEDALISLTLGGEIIGLGAGTGMPLNISIPPQSAGDTVWVTVTKQNYFRYSRSIPVEIETGNIDDLQLIRDSYILYQNYPNPFNPETDIKFRIPAGTDDGMHLVSITIYNVLGHEIAVLINKNLSAGDYSVKFDSNSIPGGLSSGIYFYSLKINNSGGSAANSITKKMILMK